MKKSEVVCKIRKKMVNNDACCCFCMLIIIIISTLFFFTQFYDFLHMMGVLMLKFIILLCLLAGAIFIHIKIYSLSMTVKRRLLQLRNTTSINIGKNLILELLTIGGLYVLILTSLCVLRYFFSEFWFIDYVLYYSFLFLLGNALIFPDTDTNEYSLDSKDRHLLSYLKGVFALQIAYLLMSNMYYYFL